MRKALLFLAFMGAATLGSAQTGVVLPEGSNTLKALHLRGYPGMGIYSPSAGSMFIGASTWGILCGESTGCLISTADGATTYASLYTTLTTNGVDVANSLWGASNSIIFEGSTANDFESTITLTNPTADRTFTLPNDSGTFVLSALSTNATDAANSAWFVSNGLRFEGLTANGFETTISPTDPTATNTLTLPDSTGTFLISTTANIIDTSNGFWVNTGELKFEGSTADASETTIGTTDPTADRTINWPDASGVVTVNPTLVADAVIQFGSTVMPDAGTDFRFDVTAGNGTNSIGVLNGSGPSAQGTSYTVVANGLAYVRPAEDQTVVRSHHLVQSATAGAVNDSATVTSDGLNIAKALYSEGVTATINPTGCTGGSGCINTALNTPNAGPAGQITLGVDVAALGWTAGQPVIYWNSGGTSPTGLDDGFVYWLLTVSTTNVTIAATKGGTIIVPTTQGDDGTQYLQRLPLSVVSIQ